MSQFRSLLARALAMSAAPAAPVAAEGDAWSCAGSDPGWELQIDGGMAQFVFPATTEMEVMLETPAEGRDWPRAFTLIGDRDTAILLVEREACLGDSGSFDYRAHVMTQRGQTPILLSGCCEALE